MINTRTISGNARIFADGIDRGEVRYELSEVLGQRGKPAEGRLMAATADVLDMGASSVTLLTDDGTEIPVAIDGVNFDGNGATALVRSEGELTV